MDLRGRPGDRFAPFFPGWQRTGTRGRVNRLLFLAPLLCRCLLHPVAQAANITSAQTGNWSAAATWGGTVPGPADTVAVAAGHTVTVDVLTATASTITVNGILSFSRAASSSLTLVGGSLLVNPGGTLDMGTAASPIPSGVKVQLILAYGAAPGQFGLIVNNGGNFTVYGAAKSPYGQAASDVPAGATSLTIPAASAAGWAVGDEITIGKTGNSSADETERRTISALAGGDPLTASWSGGLAYPHYSSGPAMVGDLTRNVLVRSSGTDVSATGHSAYILDLANNATSFALAYGEFAYLGFNDPANNRYGIAFGNYFSAPTRGSISSSTIREGYFGIELNTSIGAAFSSNLIYKNASYGIDFDGSSDNSFVANQIYSNGSDGVECFNSANNTFLANGFYSNAGRGAHLNLNCLYQTFLSNNFHSNMQDGLNLFASRNNVFVSNDSYSNRGDGYVAYGSAYGNTLVSNHFYLNRGYGIDNVGGNSSPFVAGGSLGYDAAGASAPDGSGEVGFGLSSGESAILKSVQVNPANGIDVSGLSQAGNYLLSFDQSGDTGTVRLWGDYVVSSATMTLDYATRLYTSTATTPKVMMGTSLSAASVNSTNDANAVTQRIAATYSAADGLWHVTGSVSGPLGTLPAAGGTANFPSTNPQFNLTLAASGAQNGDMADFALIAASQDAGVRKRMLFGPAAAAFNGGKSRLTIAPNGGFRLAGTSSSHAAMDQLSVSAYYSFVSSGAFSASYADINNSDSNGPWLSGAAGVSMDNVTFDYMGVGPSTCAYMTLASLTSNATFYSLNFNLSRSVAGAAAAYNVQVLPPDSGVSVTFANAGGAFAGASNDYDPNVRLRWITIPAVTFIAPQTGTLGVVRSTAVTVAFNQPVSSSSFVAALSLTMLQNNLSQAVNTPVAGSVSPSTDSAVFTFTPAAALNGNSLYQISVSTRAQSPQGISLLSAAMSQFATLLDHAVLNVVTDPSTNVSATFPAGALGADGYVRTSAAGSSANVAAANAKLISNTGDLRSAPLAGSIVDLKAYDPSGGLQSGAFGAPVTLSLPYADAGGFVAGSNPPVLSKTLGIWWLDDAHALWVRLPDSAVDASAQRVTATAPHFTTFAIIGQSAIDLSGAYAFPVPFRPKLGHTKITFTGLGQDTRIRIFTVAGERVADFDASSSGGQADWDVTNSAGDPVASGVYLYLLQSGHSVQKGKLVIIR